MRKSAVDKVRIKNGITDSAAVIMSLSAESGRLVAISSAVITALKASRKILVAGNGGSAAEAMHFAEELTGRFKSNRRALPAIALSADGTALTCIGNDFGFDAIFSRQVEAFGRKGDVLILFSTSGNSPNLVAALKAAERIGMKTICLLGKDGGFLAGKGNCEIIVKSSETARIQEAHQLILHLVLDAVEQEYSAK